MNKMLLIFLWSILFFFTSCIKSQNIEVDSNDVLAKSTQTPTVSHSNAPLKNIEQVTAWVAVFDLKEFKSSSNDIIVLYGENNDYNKLLDETSPEYKTHGGVEVDLMNCVGYLASGIVYIIQQPDDTTSLPHWRLKVSSETVSKDFEEKIKQCKTTKKPAVNEEEVGNLAFAVSPPAKKRKDIKLSEVQDLNKLLDSIPDEIKKSVNQKKTHIKSTLSLANDSWTDLDGDGKIDLLVLTGNKKGVILLLEKNQWKVIAELV